MTNYFESTRFACGQVPFSPFSPQWKLPNSQHSLEPRRIMLTKRKDSIRETKWFVQGCSEECGRVRDSTVCSSGCLVLFSDYTASWNDSGFLAAGTMMSAWQWRNWWSHHGGQILCQRFMVLILKMMFMPYMTIDHRRRCCCNERFRDGHQDAGFQVRIIRSLYA